MSKNNKPYNEDLDKEVLSEKVAEKEDFEPIETDKEPETKSIKGKVDIDKFIARRLKAINEINDEAVRNAYASRILKNR